MCCWGSRLIILCVGRIFIFIFNFQIMFTHKLSWNKDYQGFLAIQACPSILYEIKSYQVVSKQHWINTTPIFDFEKHQFINLIYRRLQLVSDSRRPCISVVLYKLGHKAMQIRAYITADVRCTIIYFLVCVNSRCTHWTFSTWRACHRGTVWRGNNNWGFLQWFSGTKKD